MSLLLKRHLTDRTSSWLPTARAETSLLLLHVLLGRKAHMLVDRLGCPSVLLPGTLHGVALLLSKVGSATAGAKVSRSLDLARFSSTRGVLPRGNSWIFCTNSQYLNVPGPWLLFLMSLLITSSRTTQQRAEQGQQRRCWRPETTYFVTSKQLDF